MVFPVVGGTQDTTPYEISNSLRFNNDDSASMTIASLGSSSSNAKKWTVSFWAKLGPGLTAHRCVFSAGEASGGEYVQINFSDEDKLQIYSSNQFGQADNTATVLRTNALYRDVSAWYHVVYAIDFTDGTAGDRIKLYVNGSRVTSFELSNNIPAQNTDNDRIGANNIDHFVGKFVDSSSEFFDGYLAEFHFIDGDAKASTDFGKTDDNGVWIPKKYGGSHGNNGFYLQFKETGTSQNSSGIGADTSGNDHHMAVTNLAALDVTVDTPTNNFATMNSLDNYHSGFTLSEGNCKFVTAGSSNAYNTATIGDLKQGKWYLEVKYTDPSHTGGGDAAGEFYGAISAIGHKLSDGVSDTDTSTDLYATSYLHNFGYDINNGRIKNNNQAGTVHGAAGVEGNIIGFLLDLDNNRVTTHLNGQYADGSGNHDESSPTAYVSITAPASTPLGGYMIGFDETVGSSESGNQNTGTYEINFGNPTFSISSGNADANGYGNFEYAVPSGYFSLCTKNLAEYG